MNLDERIAQFRKMAQANPDDDLAHYALGQALNDAERHNEAIHVLRHVLRLNAQYSRAYVLMGDAQMADGDEHGAKETYQRGYAAAMNRGDLMPANEMKSKLSDLGETVSLDAVFSGPQEPDPDGGREPDEDEVRCARTGRIGARMQFNPFESAVGNYIVENISQESWDEWIEMSIKVINELRLDLGEPEAQETYDEHMKAFLNLPDHLFAEEA